MRKRIDYIDALKGIGILLVVLGHAINSGDVSLCRWLWSFHMPLFFFISGMLFYGKDYHDVTIVSFLKRKAYSLLLPHLTLAILTIAGNVLISCFIVKTLALNEVDYLSPFLNWFLLVMFVADIMLFIKEKYINKNIIWCLTLLAESFLFFICSYNRIIYVQQIIVAIIFGDLGRLLRPYVDRYYDEAKPLNTALGKMRYGGGGLALTLLTGIGCTINESVLMYINQYGNKLIFLIISLLGILSMIDISQVFSKSPFIKFFGMNSMIIYATHFLVYRFMKGFIQHFYTEFSFVQFPNYFALFFVAICAEIPIILFANRFVPFLFGKR